MIASLQGTIWKEKPGVVTIDVGGIGYAVCVPLDTWEELEEHSDAKLPIFTYVREDRLDLFGFNDKKTKTLFIRLIDQPGIGPKIALEICAVPRQMLLFAIEKQDFKILSQVKGVGKKTAQKVLLELKNVLEKEPEIFGTHLSSHSTRHSSMDEDAIDALKQLGFSTPHILRALESAPDAKTTEERVTAALRSL